jgi:GNAT superfamily N-acetyltransferase
MRLLQTAALTPAQKEGLLQLWNLEYPQHIGHADRASLDRYLDSLSKAQHFLLDDEARPLIGWLAVFERQQAPWFALIINSQYQGQGCGTHLLALAKAQYPELKGWVIDHDEYHKANGQPYLSPIGFYEKNGFVILREVRADSPTLSTIQVQWRE